MDNLVNEVVVSLGSTNVAAGTTEIDGTSVDMSAFDEATAIAQLGTVTGGASFVLKLQQSNDNGVNDAWADITGATTGVITPVTNGIYVVSAYRPVKRYVRAVCLPTVQNVVLNSLLNVQSQPKKLPTTPDATVKSTILVMPSA